ncbi:MAG: hypothetical protein RMI94_02080 [Bryobacterales bacterium]|nr:hypothetical protein [Bryobacteraceae bacterium]MDW8129306.1 hypothetical protein [Bryobacterales bacterium]
MTSRRQFLWLASLAACRRRRSTGFPGYAVVSSPQDRSVSVVDLDVFALARRIPLPAPPRDVLAHPALPLAWVLSPEAGLLCELDLTRPGPARQLRLARDAVAMRLDPQGQTLWVLCRQPAQLLAVRTDRLERIARIPLPGEPLDFDLARYDALAAVSLAAQGVAFVDLKTARAAHPVVFGRRPGAIRFRSDGRLLLVGSADEPMLSILDVPGGQLVVHLPLAVCPARFCFKPDGGQLFLTGPGADAVAIVYPYRTEVAETVLAGRSPADMAVSSQPEYLFVASPPTGDVNILEIETRRVVAAAPVGEGVGPLAVTPDNQYVLALNCRAGALAVVRIPATVSRRRRLASLVTVVPVGPQPASLAVCHA